VSDTGVPYLILASNNKIVMQDLLEVIKESPIIYTIPDPMIYITGIQRLLVGNKIDSNAFCCSTQCLYTVNAVTRNYVFFFLINISCLCDIISQLDRCGEYQTILLHIIVTY
jgi:hypothetical protein